MISATIRGEQISNVGIPGHTSDIWLKLANRINQLAEIG